MKPVDGIDPPGSHIVSTHLKAIYNGAKTGSAIGIELNMSIVGSDHSIYTIRFKSGVAGGLDGAKDAVQGGTIEGDAFFALPAGVTSTQFRLDPGFGSDTVTIDLP